MRTPRDASHSDSRELPPAGSEAPPPPNRKSRHWLMWLMCLPMVMLVGALVVTGRVGAGGVLYALGCLAAMGLMMAWMQRHDHGQPPQ